MEELETQLNNTADGQVEQTPDNTAEDNTQTETIQDVLNKSETPETPQELWKQTKQFEQGLWKTPDDVYNSVKYYEQKFQPLEQSLKRMGFKEPAELERAQSLGQQDAPEEEVAIHCSILA